MRIGVIGGTGREGFGLAVRWAKAGHAVTIGSRDPERARARAETISKQGWSVSGGSNADACRDADIVVLSVPYSAHSETLSALKEKLEGKIVIDITVPLVPPRVREVTLPAGHAAALEAQRLLGSKTRVVAALHHVSSAHLSELSHAIECDVLVCTNDSEARSAVMALIQDLGLRALDAGPLQNAVALEALTPVLLHLNKVYGGSGAGVRFTGLPQ
jgi:8-hydroxy-5-deazaflavin:NADPH oxidoreductase